ncbi:MAG: DUF1638 domain-containing protein [Verrucomicrobia bacterium]|nr:DUF1638 domain-containing protein [Verrucomicrobiota bacterium]
MRLKLIACDVLTREVCWSVARSPHVIDLEFTPKGAHDESDTLRAMLQSKIDAASVSPEPYNAILLAYGICGNSTVGLCARTTRLVIPRAHDCCTLFLGSKAAFSKHFGSNPSQPFSTAGYIERGDWDSLSTTTARLLGTDKTFDDYVRLYGEENARYIAETMNASLDQGESDTLVYIDVAETHNAALKAECRARAEAAGKRFVELGGSVRLLARLANGDWDPDEFLVVEPGQRVMGVYDLDEVMRAKDHTE